MAPKKDVSGLTRKQHFWKTLFKEYDLARQIPKWAGDVNEYGTKRFEIPHYGEVLVEAKQASKLGDNFMSDTFIVEATEMRTNAKFSGFIKVLPSNAVMRETAYQSRAHHREINVYRDLFDALNKLRGDLPIPLDAPEFYYGIVEEKVKGISDGAGTCILIEDLKTQGFSMVDKCKGVDNDHVRLALTALAHYHALTIAALRQWTDPETGELTRLPVSMKFLNEKTFYDYNPVDVIDKWIDVFAGFTEDLDRPDLTEWINAMSKRLTDIVVVDSIKTSGPLACILHGDFWSNNMLFKYEQLPQVSNGNSELHSRRPRPSAVKMVDFQVSRIGNPITDVLYFLYSSTTAELRSRHLDEWLSSYYEALNADLKLLNVHVPDDAFDTFMEDYRQRSAMWMLFGGMIMCMVLNKRVVDSLSDIGEKMQTEPKKDANEEKQIGESGFSVDVEDKMKKMMRSSRLSDNRLLSDRLVKLFDEVKALQERN